MASDSTPAPTEAATAPSLAPTAAPTQTITPMQPPQPEPTTAVSSPLAEIPLSELEEILTTPFQRPAPGLDDGHHGVDFSFYTRGERYDILGLPVLSVLDGRVAAVITDRPPYGNMILVETPLDQLPAEWIDALGLDASPDAPTQPPRLQCPEQERPFAPEGQQRSLYLLYAHLQEPPAFSIGDQVLSGQQIGLVGNTGMSGNPHLHLEVRVGPSFATFDQMAHYTNSATPEEMAAYCAWRISGQFHMLDPVAFIRLAAAR